MQFISMISVRSFRSLFRNFKRQNKLMMHSDVSCSSHKSFLTDKMIDNSIFWRFDRIFIFVMNLWLWEVIFRLLYILEEIFKFIETYINKQVSTSNYKIKTFVSILSDPSKIFIETRNFHFCHELSLHSNKKKNCENFEYRLEYLLHGTFCTTRWKGGDRRRRNVEEDR